MANYSEIEMIQLRLKELWEDGMKHAQGWLETARTQEWVRVIENQYRSLDEDQQQIAAICVFVVFFTFVIYLLTKSPEKKEEPKPRDEYPQEPMTPITQFHRLHRQVEDHVKDVDFGEEETSKEEEAPEKENDNQEPEEGREEIDNEFLVEDPEEKMQELPDLPSGSYESDDSVSIGSQSDTNENENENDNIFMKDQLFTPTQNFSNIYASKGALFAEPSPMPAHHGTPFPELYSTQTENVEEVEDVEETTQPSTPVEPLPEPKDITSFGRGDVSIDTINAHASEEEQAPSEPIELTPRLSKQATPDSESVEDENKENVSDNVRRRESSKIPRPSSIRSKPLPTTPKRSSSRLTKTPTRFSPAGVMVSSDSIGRRRSVRK